MDPNLDRPPARWLEPAEDEQLGGFATTIRAQGAAYRGLRELALAGSMETTTGSHQAARRSDQWRAAGQDSRALAPVCRKLDGGLWYVSQAFFPPSSECGARSWWWQDQAELAARIADQYDTALSNLSQSAAMAEWAEEVLQRRWGHRGERIGEASRPRT